MIGFTAKPSLILAKHWESKSTAAKLRNLTLFFFFGIMGIFAKPHNHNFKDVEIAI